jgi:hypothetical protein
LTVREGGRDVKKTVLQQHVGELQARKSESERKAIADAKQREADNARRITEAADKKKEEDLKRTGDLRGAYESNSVTKATYVKLNAFDDLMTIPGSMQKRTASHDMKMVYQIMKMYDPNSSVKEGEYAMAEQARGVPDTVRNTYNSLFTGNRLTDTQVANFKKTALETMAGQMKSQDLVDQRYRSLADKQGYDSTLVISPEFDKIREEIGSLPSKAVARPDSRKPAVFPASVPSQLSLPAEEPSAEDRAALQWLQANPDDPNAERVKNVLKSKGIPVPESIPARGMRIPRNKMG